MSTALDKLKARLADINALHAAQAMMDWDQQCFMPHGGSEARAEHQGSLSRMSHEMFTDDETKNLIEKAKAEVESNSDDADMLRVVSRDLEISTKIPSSLVAKKSRLSALAHDKWVTARANNDFKGFAPSLAEMVEIAREEGEYLGYTNHIYDALTDQYEEGATKKYWDDMFGTIRQPLVDLVAQIKEAPQVDDAFLTGDWEKEAQKNFSLKIIEAIGFDMNRGRLDTAPHPFCTGWFDRRYPIDDTISRLLAKCSIWLASRSRTRNVRARFTHEMGPNAARRRRIARYAREPISNLGKHCWTQLSVLAAFLRRSTINIPGFEKQIIR